MDHQLTPRSDFKAPRGLFVVSQRGRKRRPLRGIPGVGGGNQAGPLWEPHARPYKPLGVVFWGN